MTLQSTTISNARSIARTVTPIVLDIYDRESPESLLPLLARTLPGEPGQKDFELEWWSAFPELRKWVGDRQTQKVFQDTLKGSIDPYEVTYSLDRRDVDSKSLVKAEDLASSIARAFLLGKVDLAYRPMRDNVLAYDGQNFFDSDHVHPNDKTFSNLLTIGTATAARTTAAEPTAVEVREELKVAMQQLLANTLIRNVITETNRIEDGLVVTVRRDAEWRAFYDLLTEDNLGGEGDRRNSFKGKFRLLRDHNPPAGEEDSYDVVRAVPNGPRPAIFVAAREPRGLDFDEAQVFRNRHIDFGMDAEYGVAAGFPQVAVRMTL